MMGESPDDSMTARYRLVLRHGGLLPDVPLSLPSLTCGRDVGCDIVISEPSVSRVHARLLVGEDDGVGIEDLGSSAGTFVNGKRVARAALRPGDLVRFGARAEYELTLSGGEWLAGSSGSAADSSPASGVREMKALMDAAERINAATVMSEVIDRALQAAASATGATRACLVLVDPNGDVDSVAWFPPPATEAPPSPPGELLLKAIATRRTLSGMSETYGGEALDALAAPLQVVRRPLGPPQLDSIIVHTAVVGGLLVEGARRGRGFTRAERSLVESLAIDAAMVIDGARLYRESRDKAKIEHEMRLARAMQTALLRAPDETPFCEVYAASEPARSVGGDLYHGAASPDGTLALSLGDVSGKGVAAALGMAMAQGLLELIATLRPPLADVPQIVNRSLLPYNEGSRYVTLASAILHPDGRLDILNAGHCPPIVFRRSGAIEFVGSGGTFLGLLPSGQWDVETRQLDPGDTLVLYSDGVTDAESPAGREFGTNGLVEGLSGLAGQPPRSIVEELLRIVEAHRAGRPAPDDLTVLAARFTGSAT
jgi:sigma-B regulation protein RsbU (phosphoserine phosphatase)